LLYGTRTDHSEGPAVEVVHPAEVKNTVAPERLQRIAEHEQFPSAEVSEVLKTTAKASFKQPGWERLRPGRSLEKSRRPGPDSPGRSNPLKIGRGLPHQLGGSR